MTKPLLPSGLYEHVVTRDLAQSLSRLPPTRSHKLQPLDGADAHAVLSRHLAAEVARALTSIPANDRPRAQVEIINQLLSSLRALVPADAGDSIDDADVALPGDQLLSVYSGNAPERPASPLGASTLLTRNRAEPSLGTELNREIASADRIDVLVAFITMGGFRALRDSLERFCARFSASASASATAPRLRILTTVFTGTTEVAAVEALAALPGVSIKISYDTRRTRLHAKAWLFQRDTELHSAYVGSVNLTATALGSGQEWMVKACAADLPHVIEKFKGTFEALWNDPEFELFDAGSAACRTRLREALDAQDRAPDVALRFFALRPLPFQEEILERLQADRVLHDRRRNLVVAATGTGKTVIAAFDYRREADRTAVPPRLLFLAHRRELLDQALQTFRHVMRDGAFGELLLGGEEPTRWQHVFATIQTAARRDLIARFGADYFHYVVIDECHHAPADSYQTLVPQLRPNILLGLTATPERVDGKSLLPDFDGHIAAELRIWHALERQLLVPFEYYGVSDTTSSAGIAASSASTRSSRRSPACHAVAWPGRWIRAFRTFPAVACCSSMPLRASECLARCARTWGVARAWRKRCKT